MNNLDFDTQQLWLLIIIVIAILFFVFVFLKRNKEKKIKKQLSMLHVSFNSIKSIPLSFKLQKAISIAKIDEEIIKKIEDIKDDFETANNELEDLGKNLEEVEDLVLSRKYKNIFDEFKNIDNQIKESEIKITRINGVLDNILERESQERNKANTIKEKYSALTLLYNQKIKFLGSAAKNIEDRIIECSEMFSNFEEWMFASEYVKATQCLSNVETKIIETEYLINRIPELLEIATEAIPALLKQTEKQYNNTKFKDIYLEHLNTEEKIDKIKKEVDETIYKIKIGDIENVDIVLKDITSRLRKLILEFTKEADAASRIGDIIDLNDRVIEVINKDYNYIDSCYQVNKEKFNLEVYDELIASKDKYLNYYNQSQEDLKSRIKSKNQPSTDLEALAINFIKELELKQNELKDIKDKIDHAKVDEERAIIESAKHQLVLNEIKINILSKKLPSFSEIYVNDIQKGFEYVDKIKYALKEVPLNQAKLKTLVDNSIHYIIKLKNSVETTLEIANNVENIIVFANKYRSTYPDVESDMTRAELAYQNGSYLNAYEIALSALNKIFPDKKNREVFQKVTSDK